MKRSCLDCGIEFEPTNPRQRRCPRHQGSATGYSHNRDTTAQGRFRLALRRRAGDRCEWIEDGERCTETEDLRACHLTPLADGGGYDPDDGLLLCRAHDRQIDSRAR